MKRRPAHRSRGVAAIELAIVLIPLLVLVFGITEFGRAMYEYNTVVKAVRDGARYLSTQNVGIGRATAQCIVVYGRITPCSGTPLAPGLSTAIVETVDAANCTAADVGLTAGCTVSQQSVPTGSGVVNTVTVRVNGYVFTSLVSFALGNVTVGTPSGTITFGPISATMIQVN